MSLQNKPNTIRATSFREALKVRFLSNHLRIFPVQERTLDIGCGYGFSLKINPNFFCVDADKAAIQYLKAKCSFSCPFLKKTNPIANISMVRVTLF